MVTRGEVWWYEPPGAGRRPFLILTRTEACPVLNQLIGIPATRVQRDIPTEVALGPADGMPGPCVLSLDNVTLIRPSFCTRLVATLSPDRMTEVCTALGYATGC